MSSVGLLLNTARAALVTFKQRASEIAAVTLLGEAYSAIKRYAEPHWSGCTLAELPSMIHDLARDRDDFKAMATSYREELAAAEKRNQELEAALQKKTAECIAYHDHEPWCGVFSVCSCRDLDEDDP